MEIVKLTWEGLVDRNGEVSERSSKIYEIIESAFIKLEPVMWDFGVKLVLEKKFVSQNEIKNNCSATGIYINGEPIEEILNNLSNDKLKEISESSIAIALFTKISKRI